MISPNGIAHIQLTVRDVAASRPFIERAVFRLVRNARGVNVRETSETSMMRRLAWALTLALLIAPSTTSHAQQTEVSCPHRAGFVDGPYVATADTARAIATALVQQMQPRERQEQYDLNIRDDGDHWIAFQSARGYPRREGEAIIVMMGGGSLEMRIAKCDGAISELHWSR